MDSEDPESALHSALSATPDKQLHLVGRSVQLDHLVRGRTNKQIAQRLGVTDHTVQTQVTRIYEKLEVRNRVDLYALAVERGWVKASR